MVAYEIVDESACSRSSLVKPFRSLCLPGASLLVSLSSTFDVFSDDEVSVTHLTDLHLYTCFVQKT